MGAMELLHPITGLTAIGLLLDGRPVWPVLGAEGDEDEGTTEEEGAEEEGSEDADQEEGADEESEKPAAKKVADTVARTELTKATRARDLAKKEARDLRAENARLKREGEDETARLVREAGEAAKAEADKLYKPLLVRKEATSELIAAGVKKDKVPRLIKLLELDEIEIDGDEFVGLTSQVEALKEEWPELFEEPKPTREQRPSSRAADGADKKPAPKKDLTPTERQALALQGRMG